MPKMTILEMVQDILSDMDSDSVNSINDTVEALQISQILETTYFEMISNTHQPHLKTLFQLEAANTTRPTHMKVSDEVQELIWLKYNKRKSTDTKDKYEDVKYLPSDEFLATIMNRDSSKSDVTRVTDLSGVTLLIFNDTAPTYWTSFDDEYIVFDSYDSAVDSFLQQSKSMLEGYKEPTFTQTDSFVPDLPSKVFPKYLAEAKSVAFNTIKQMPNAKEEQKVRRQSIYLSRNKRRTAGGISYPDYGRKSAK